MGVFTPPCCRLSSPPSRRLQARVGIRGSGSGYRPIALRIVQPAPIWVAGAMSGSHRALGSIHSVHTENGTTSLREEPDMHYKVLVVDDSKLARMVMASALRRIRPDWELVEATSAVDAIAAIPARSVDIALVDFNMPETDGLELVANIRQAHPDMPVALVSANLQDEIISRARELSAAFIAKPLTDEALGAFLSGAVLRLKKRT